MAKEKILSTLRNWVPVNGNGHGDGLVREQTTGRQGERRTYVLDPYYSAKDQQFIYRYRRDTKAPLVASYGSELVKDFGSSHSLDKKAAKERKKNVYLSTITEHIPRRLADTPQLTFGESLYVLDRSLEGYETAYDKVGPMYINDRMIGFTPEGYAKVWINEDFANNHPSHPRSILESTREDGSHFLESRNVLPMTGSDEADFVENVVDVVADHTEQGRYPEPFSHEIHQRGYGFRDTRRFIRDYAVRNNIFVPDRVDFWNQRVWGWREARNTNVHTKTYVPPVTNTRVTTVVQEPTHGYRFNYIPPEHQYEPQIFASRIGEHGNYQGHRY